MLGLTQDGLGNVVGVHWTTVSRWERETVTIPAPTAKLLELLAASHTRKRRK
jgi:DNA-binding transcriptional regulator YiaG